MLDGVDVLNDIVQGVAMGKSDILRLHKSLNPLQLLLIVGFDCSLWQCLVHDSNQQSQGDDTLLTIHDFIVVQHQRAEAILLLMLEGKKVGNQLIDILCGPLVGSLIGRDDQLVEGQLAHSADFHFQLPSLLRLKFVDMIRRQSFALCDVVLHLLKEVVIDRNCHLLYVFQTYTLRTVQLQFQSLGLFIRCCFIDYKLPSIGCSHPQRIAHGSLPCSSPASQIYSSIGVQSS